METSFISTLSENGEDYRDQIERLKDENDFEERGDALFLHHPDDEARLLWAFHRPSGSHPVQVADPNAEVAIMAFNHSRLGAYERFTRLNPGVIADANLRRHIRNRSRMLFRALVDDDFTELLQVLDFAPVFIDQACDQMINGRIWNEKYASAVHASQFLNRVGELIDERLGEGVIRRLKPLKEYGFDEAKQLLESLASSSEALHPLIRDHYIDAFGRWMKREKLHPLQTIVLQKTLDRIKNG